MRTTVLVVALGVVLAGATVVAARSAQDPRLVLPPAEIPKEEAAALAQYWILLAEGRFAEAEAGVSQLLAKYPRNISVVALALETTIGRGGASAALQQYESWLGGRPQEEPALLRRVARAFLYEWARQESNGQARSEALEALAEDGDPFAMNVLAAMAQVDSEAGLRAAVHLKQPQAIARVAERIRGMGGLKLREIDMLADSGSPQAVPVLVEVLNNDLDPANREAAARALGAIGGPAAEQALTPILNDAHGLVRTAAAGALFRMGNYAGINILAGLAANENSSIRRSAARLMQSRPDESWKALVRGLLSDPDPAIRLDAARMLAPVEPETARPVLSALTNDNNVAIREETELALADLPGATLRDLRTILRSGRGLARVRAAARMLQLSR